METLPIKKWGNSNGLRLPKNIMEYLDVQTNDQVSLVKEEKNGKKRLIIEAAAPQQELTIEELFADYNGEQFKAELIDLGEAEGQELW